MANYGWHPPRRLPRTMHADDPAPRGARPETLCVQAREDLPGANRPLVAPIYQTAVWTLASAEECDAVYGGETPGWIYTREANPNHAALERSVAALEGAEGGVVFGSGMAAVAAVLTAFAGAGAHVAAERRLYGASVRLLTEEAPRFGVQVRWTDTTDAEATERSLEGAALLLVETLANPLLQVADVPRLAALCRKQGALLAVDSTFASPLVCRPLELGADVVVHSLGKFLGGHGDLTLGAAAARREQAEAMRRHARLWGGTANPFESWLAARGLATYPLRIERACSNAQALAERLQAHPAVRRVHYPGLPSHPQHALAREVLRLPGAMLAFDMADGAAARKVLRRLRHVRFAPSLGDVATTISYPITTSQRGLPPDVVAEMGITAGTLRLSTGIDHVDDVWEDLEQALA